MRPPQGKTSSMQLARFHRGSLLQEKKKKKKKLPFCYLGSEAAVVLLWTHFSLRRGRRPRQRWSTFTADNDFAVIHSYSLFDLSLSSFCSMFEPQTKSWRQAACPSIHPSTFLLFIHRKRGWCFTAVPQKITETKDLVCKVSHSGQNSKYVQNVGGKKVKKDIKWKRVIFTLYTSTHSTEYFYIANWPQLNPG